MLSAKSIQSCLTLCDPIDGSPPGSPIPGILQARTLEWVAISFSNAWKWKGKVKSLSHARLSATPWTAAYQAPPSMGFSRQEYWSGLPLPYRCKFLWGDMEKCTLVSHNLHKINVLIRGNMIQLHAFWQMYSFVIIPHIKNKYFHHLKNFPHVTFPSIPPHLHRGNCYLDL